MNNFDYCNGVIHIIKKGDTVYSLSGRYNVPIAIILRANPYIDIYNLQIGDKLCIPVMPGQCENVTKIHIVKNGESIMDILDCFNIDLNELLRYNNLCDMKLMAGMKINIPCRESN